MATLANVASLLSLLAFAGLASAAQLKGRGAGMEEDGAANPVQKVVSLLQEMKRQAAKEAEQDKGAYEKYGCWCAANKDAKTEAVDAAEKRIAQLEAFLEEVAGLQAQLTTEISGLEAGIVEDQDALAAATGIRERETAEFHARENEAVETISTLEEALKVLARVQLLQRKGAGSAAEAKPLLLQLDTALKGIHMGAYQEVMQRDMWDLMGSIGESSGGPAFLRAGGRLSAIEQHGQLSVGQSPEGLAGHAAGASSYSAHSGGVYGMLGQMKDEFEKSLAEDRKLEQQAAAAFQKLRAAKLAEISSAQASKAEKNQRLATAVSEQAQSKEELSATQEALSADQKFLLGLEKNCAANEEDYAQRAKARSEELVALAETIAILTTDDARDHFIKLTLLQTGSIRRGSAAGRGRQATEAEQARNSALDAAMQRILRVARKQKNWALASLAVHVRLDAFAKVKEAMDKMTAELKAQQKDEVEKKDFCNQQIDTTEDSLKAKSNEQEDLEGKKLGLENSIAELEADLQELRSQVVQMKESLKRGSEDRSAENKIFQQAIMDQRATAQILKKAKARLAKFYSTQSASLAQGSSKQGQQQGAAQPGQPVEAPPPKPEAYAKSGGAGGVLQLLDMILTDAAKEEAELLASEQHAQTGYEGMVKDTNTAIGASEAAIVDKTKLSSEAASGESEAKAALLANEQDRTSLGETLKGMHLDCDYLLKFFDVRQEARQDELDAIAEAKAVLSGADFQRAATA